MPLPPTTTGDPCPIRIIRTTSIAMGPEILAAAVAVEVEVEVEAVRTVAEESRSVCVVKSRTV